MEFETQKQKGKKAEELIRRRLEARGWIVADVRNHDYFRECDVDFVISNDKNQSFMVDVKCDTYPPNNFFIETAKETTERPGRIYRTHADYWLYYFDSADTLYSFHPPKMRDHLTTNNFRTAKALTNNGGYFSWAIGKLVPIISAPVASVVTNASNFEQ